MLDMVRRRQLGTAEQEAARQLRIVLTEVETGDEATTEQLLAQLGAEPRTVQDELVEERSRRQQPVAGQSAEPIGELDGPLVGKAGDGAESRWAEQAQIGSDTESEQGLAG